LGGKWQRDIATSSEALQTRLAVNQQLGSRDFDGWVLARLQPKPGEYILDIGCGTGKFAIPCAQILGDKGGVTAVDISEQSLMKLKAEAEAQGLNITLICARMEDLSCYAPARFFDAALSSYTLYYSDPPGQTIRTIHQCLKQGGRLVVVGPDKGNNQELVDLLQPVIVIPESHTYTQDFSYKIVIPTCGELFTEVVSDRFENAVRFPNARLLLDYWRAGDYYCSEAEQAVQKVVAAYFTEHSEFVLHKRVVSVLAMGAKT
jgi:ubiquinone/menaquinone biosynthesis C-methylase UbiE